mgnify:CR=1 FL=1
MTTVSFQSILQAGDSLAALRFVLAVEEATGQRLPTELFREPTVAYLAWLSAGSPTPSPAREPDATSHYRSPSSLPVGR